MLRHLTSRRGVIVLAAIATASKLVFALLTEGTNDVGTFHRFGAFISEHGLGDMYRADPEFNHVPLTALLSAIAAHLDGFPFWIRLPGILADLGTIWALLRLRELTGRPPGWGLALFALSPVSVLVSGFHGNVDPLMTMALVWAFVMTVEDRPVASGAWLALAVNVKVAAVLLAPLLILIWWHRGRTRAFLPVCGALTLAGWLPALVVAPSQFVSQVLGYDSNWGSWGIPLVLSRIGGDAMEPLAGFANLTPEQSVIASTLKVAILLGAFTAAWLGRRARGDTVFLYAALTWAIFFALAVGVGAQYLVWLAPFFVVAVPRAYVTVTVTSTASLIAFYGITSHGNWNFAHSTADLTDRWEPWTVLPWLAIAATGVLLVRAIRADRAEPVP